MLNKKSVSKWHTIINDHIVDTGVGNLQGMGPSNFAAWMGNKRVSKKCISASTMRGMRHFSVIGMGQTQTERRFQIKL